MSAIYPDKELAAEQAALLSIAHRRCDVEAVKQLYSKRTDSFIDVADLEGTLELFDVTRRMKLSTINGSIDLLTVSARYSLRAEHKARANDGRMLAHAHVAVTLAIGVTDLHTTNNIRTPSTKPLLKG